MHISYKIANTIREFENGKKLFQQYANSLNLDLSFQDFKNELKTIDKQYNKPRGALILAYSGKIAVGCAGIRELDKQTAELKRMYVSTEYRGCRIGLKLLEQCINIAKKLNYSKIRLDTLPNMTQAQNLYYASGFYEIPSYRFNPIKGTVYMEKKLW
jgi:ribosomal protein S18 acetylase RimI-like enzyme